MTKTRCAVLILAAALGAQAAVAQDAPGSGELRPRFELTLGGFFATSNAGLQVDSDALGPGTEIDLETDLGFDSDETAPRIAGLLRWGERRRHRIEASWFALSREGRRVIDREIQFGDRTFQVNADIRAELELDLFKVGYTYMFFQRESAEIGGSIGVFGIAQRASLSEATLGATESSDLTFPLPTIGARGDFDIWRRTRLKTSADVFFIDTGEYSGELYDLYAGVEYDILENVGVGLGYNYADLEVGASESEGDVDLSFSYDGPFAYIKFML